MNLVSEAGTKPNSDSLAYAQHASTTSNAAILFMIWSAQRAGQSCLPISLGLSEAKLAALSHYLGEAGFACERRAISTEGEEDLRQDLLDMRQDEWQELHGLLLEYGAGEDLSEQWLADIVAAGCLGGDHLWRDLGLANRGLLSELLHRNFPRLASANTKDMKWKKFFYKQLCEREGAYVCRAPSCEQCAAYQDCFGPEE